MESDFESIIKSKTAKVETNNKLKVNVKPVDLVIRLSDMMVKLKNL